MNNTQQTEAKGKKFDGTVWAIGQDKTITVVLSHDRVHPLYSKKIRRTKKFLVHNPTFELAKGDGVTIMETKPISKRKHFIVVEKL